MLEVLFIQDFKVEDLFCFASSDSGPSLRFNNYLFNLGFKPVQDDFLHDFADLTGADCSPVLRCHHNSHVCTVLSNILSIC